MTSAVYGRPSAYITDVYFDGCGGKNILCASPYIDLKGTYKVNFTPSSSAFTFMAVTDRQKISGWNFFLNLCYFNED